MSATQNKPECDCGMPHLDGTEHMDECPAGIYERNPILQQRVIVVRSRAGCVHCGTSDDPYSYCPAHDWHRHV